ncbi:MAG TPA: hypothetical protein VFY69_05050 [Solirubrobacterales bacterium]|nr:hypothetical protein [Solirubrobacterales bacterium]
MPWWLARKAAPHVWKRVPWAKVWVATLWLVKKGQDRIQQNLTKHEQADFWDLIKKSKGRPGNLSKRDKSRVKDLVGKAIRG